MNIHSRREIIECYQNYHRPEFLEWDPLFIIRQHLGKPGVEEMALIGALFAFGAVGQIKKSLAIAIDQDPGLPVHGLNENESAELYLKAYSGFRHRIYIDRDLVMLKLLYRRSVLAYGSLENHFGLYHDPERDEVGEALARVIQDYRKWVHEIEFSPGNHFKHMLNSPEQKSACKRWLMYLKWMIRPDDGFDLGLWNSKRFLPRQLIIPLDTHLFKISRKLKLTRRKSANWLTALEVTRELKKIDPEDPTKFDFSLCRIGMLNHRKKLNLT